MRPLLLPVEVYGWLFGNFCVIVMLSGKYGRSIGQGLDSGVAFVGWGHEQYSAIGFCGCVFSIYLGLGASAQRRQ